MIPAELQVCEDELRKAVARGQYDEVELRIEEMRRIADGMPQAARQEIAGSILSTIEWVRQMVVTQRQTWAEELAQLPQVDRFVESAGVTSEVCLDL